MANTKDVFKTQATRVLSSTISYTHSRGLALQKITSKLHSIQLLMLFTSYLKYMT